MKWLHMIAFLLVIVGGINWLLYALMGWEIGSLVGGMDSMLAQVIYILVGLSAIYLAVMHKKDCVHCMKGGGAM